MTVVVHKKARQIFPQGTQGTGFSKFCEIRCQAKKRVQTTGQTWEEIHHSSFSLPIQYLVLVPVQWPQIPVTYFHILTFTYPCFWSSIFQNMGLYTCPSSPASTDSSSLFFFLVFVYFSSSSLLTSKFMLPAAKGRRCPLGVRPSVRSQDTVAAQHGGCVEENLIYTREIKRLFSKV